MLVLMLFFLVLLFVIFNDINNEMLDTKNSKKSLELSKEKFIYETEIYKLALDRKEKGYISENNLLNSEYSFIEKSLDLLNYCRFAFNKSSKI